MESELSAHINAIDNYQQFQVLKYIKEILYADPPQNVHTTWDLGFASWAFGLRPHMGPM